MSGWKAIRKRWRVIGTGVMLGGAALVTALSGESALRPPPDAATLGLLSRYAYVFAAEEEGDARPVGGYVVSTTRRQVNALVNGGMEVPTDQDAYALVLLGDFHDNFAPVPEGAASPSGHQLILVLDAESHDLLDFFLGDVPLPVDRLGPVVPILPPPPD